MIYQKYNIYIAIAPQEKETERQRESPGVIWMRRNDDDQEQFKARTRTSIPSGRRAADGPLETAEGEMCGGNRQTVGHSSGSAISISTVENRTIIYGGGP